MKLKTYVFKANEHFDYSDFLKKEDFRNYHK